MKKTITLLLLFVSSMTFAQEHIITGSVSDESTKELLEAATVYIEAMADSTVVTYSITDQKGKFELDFKTKDPKVRLYVSYNSYQTFKKVVELDKRSIDLGQLFLSPQLEELASVSVVGIRAPITIKKDTVEFNADAFKTRPDANVEDLIKKLPGVQIDTDGKITVNGKEVNRVLVNGTTFFGNDPKVATKNLPKDIIDKIQVMDTRSKTEEFTGKESRSDNKTINITIKKDKNSGYFSRVTAGYGTNDRYDLNGMINYFRDKQRFSLLASSNNINSTGFSFDEVFSASGRRGGQQRGSFGGGGGGGSQGITRSSTVGGNFADQLQDKTEISGDYMYANSDSYNDTRTSRENILPDRRYFTNSESHSDNSQDSHRANAEMEFQISPTLRIELQPRFNVTGNFSNTTRDEESLDENGTRINEASSKNSSDSERKDFSNNLEVIKKYGNKGGFLKFGFGNSNSVGTGEALLYSENRVFGNAPSEEIRDQVSYSDNKDNSWNAGLDFRQPVANSLYLDYSYKYSIGTNYNKKAVYDFNSISNDYSDFNTALSSDFEFRNQQHSPSLDLNYEGEKFSAGAGASYVNTQLDNSDALRGGSFDKGFNNLLFNADFRYRPARSKSIELNYRSGVDIPSVQQLQPIDNISNPLNIVTGNPNLKPGVSHRFRLNIRNFNWQTRTGMFSFVNFEKQNDRITNTTVTDENFLRKTTYTNVDGNYNASAGVFYNKQISKDSTFTFSSNVGFFSGLNNNVSFNNGVKFSARDLSITPRVGMNFNYRELIDFNPAYSMAINKTTYSLENRDDVKFINHNLELQTTTYWPKFLIWGNDFTYTYNGNISGNFDKSALFWNMSLGVNIFKDKGNLKIIAYDLLDQNINTRRTATEDYIQETQGTVLEQYFMLSFTFKLDKFGGQPGRGMGGPGGRGGRGGHGGRGGYRMMRF